MIATKGTDRIVSDLVDILKMIGPILQFYQCESLYKTQKRLKTISIRN